MQKSVEKNIQRSDARFTECLNFVSSIQTVWNFYENFMLKMFNETGNWFLSEGQYVSPAGVDIHSEPKYSFI